MGYGTLLRERNVLKGATPTLAIFGTNPTNLTNITDENTTTVSGTGSKTAGGAGEIGTLTFDLGTIKTVSVAGLVEMWQSASTTMYLYLRISDDNNAWRTLKTELTNSNATNTGTIRPLNSSIVTTRYLQFQVYIAGAATGNINIYDLRAYEKGGT